MKKIITAVVLLFLAVMTPFRTAAEPPQVLKSLHEDFSGQLYDFSLDGEQLDKGSLLHLSAHPGSSVEIELMGRDGDLFLDQNGQPMNTADVTASRLRAADAGVYVEAFEGGNTLKSAELVVKSGSGSVSPVIVIDFKADLDSLVPAAFNFDVFITINGDVQPQSRLTLSGMFGYEEIEVGYGDEAVMPDGSVMVAASDLEEVEINAGTEVFVTASMQEGGRYRAVAAEGQEREEDLRALSLNKGLACIIELSCDGFEDGDIKNVRIMSEEDLYVYDEDGILLGMTTEPLPLREKYYLLTRIAES